MGGVVRLLALCAHVAATLPYKRADEPLVVVYHVNLVVSRRGEDVLSALKTSLAIGGAAAAQVRSSLSLLSQFTPGTECSSPQPALPPYIRCAAGLSNIS